MLSLEDFDGREMKEDLNPFNVLLEVAAVASEKFEREKRLKREKDQSTFGFRDDLVSSPKKPRSIRYVSPLSAKLSERKRGWFSYETSTGFLKKEFLVQEGKSVKVDGPGMIRENTTDFVGKNSMRTHVAYCSNMSPIVRENSSQKDGVSGGEEVMDKTKLERLMTEKILKRPVAVDEDEENEMRFETVESEEHGLNMWSDPTPDMLMNEWLVGDKLFGKEIAYPEFDKAKQDRLMRDMYVETESSLNNEEKKGRKRNFEVVDCVEHILKFKNKKSLKNDTAEPDLPQEIWQRIMELEGINIVLVLQKKLYNADVSKGQTRFSIPRNQVKNKFLREDEERRIHKYDGKKWMAIKVLLIQPDLQESRLDLKIWNMKKVSGGSNSSYVIVGGWYSVAKSNHLKIDDLVQLWAFRRGTELCFALVVVQRAQVEDGNNSSNANGESHKSEDH